jgi:hypothetical protein
LKNLPFPFHEVAALYPLSKDDEFDELLENIKAQGLLNEIVLYQDQVIEGRRRMLACIMSGTQLRYKEVTGSIDPYRYVIAFHQHRRNLGKSSLACCTVLALPYFEAAAKERQRAGPKKGEESPVGLNVSQRAEADRSAQIVADEFRVSRAMVNLAKRLHKGNRAMFDKVLAGKISLNAAMQKLRKKNADQTSAVEEVSVQSPIQRVLAHLRSRREDSTKSLKASQTLLDEIEQMLSCEENKL